MESVTVEEGYFFVLFEEYSTSIGTEGSGYRHLFRQGSTLSSGLRHITVPVPKQSIYTIGENNIGSRSQPSDLICRHRWRNRSPVITDTKCYHRYENRT